MKGFLVHIALFLAAPILVSAQKVEVQPTRTEVVIADTFGLWVSASVPQDATFEYPNWSSGSIGAFSIHSLGQPVEDSYQGQQQFLQRLTIQAFDTGRMLVGPVEVNYQFEGDTLQTVSSDSIYVQVLLREPIDSNKVYDIYEPLSVKYTFKERLQDPFWKNIIIALAVLLVLAIAIVIWLILRKRKEKVDEGSKLPAHEIAFRKLQKLEQDKIWQKGKVKEYYSDLTNIVREYLENRYDIHAMEETTNEILDQISKAEMEAGSRDRMQDLLNLSDMVKFAKEEPGPHDHQRSLENAREFVKETRERDDEKPNADEIEEAGRD